EEEVWIAAQLYGEYRVMVCIGSQWENKRLFPSMWALLLKQLDEKKGVHFYFVWGSEKEKQEGRELHRQFKECSTLLPKLSLPVWQRMMGEMDLILSVDSSALHLAGASGVPTASFFGPSSAAVCKPPGKNHLAYQGACPYGQTFTKRCPFLRTCPSGACLKAQPPKELLDFMKQVGADRS
ncbi:MAG: glycosyltransferase family 9 protein, partial [Chlamydiia bacterium]|nr:glycosyltransferase family 9 protein [Chlamydiia bacterium]